MSKLTKQQQGDEAWETYTATVDSAYKAHKATSDATLKAYNAICKSAYEAYKAIDEPAYKAKPDAQPDEVAEIITFKGREYKLIENEES